MYLIQPIDSLEERIEIFNNKLICKDEIRSIILENFEADPESSKPFILYNPLKFSEKLEEHALIKDVVTRTNIFPKRKFSVLVNEEKPWAIFRNKVFNSKFKIIKDFSDASTEHECDSVSELYHSILNDKSSVIQILSNKDLDIKDFKKIKTISDQIDERLVMIDEAKITSINIIDEDLSLGNRNIKVIFGNYEKRVKNKIQKLEHLLSNIKENSVFS